MAHEKAAEFLSQLANAGKGGDTRPMVNLLLEKAGIEEHWGPNETWEQFRERAGDDVRAAVEEARRRSRHLRGRDG